MIQEIQTGVAVLGGGCAGLWLAHDLARRGYDCTIIEDGGLAGFASQRNQSWLHSGALYAVIASEISQDEIQAGLAQTARECLRAYSKIRHFARRHCRRAINSKSECVFLFDNEQKAEAARRFLGKVGLEPRVVSSALHLLEPVLTGTAARVGLITKDVPFESPALLGAVVRRAQHFGVRFVDSRTPLKDLQFQRGDDTQWFISARNLRVFASVVVCTTGTLVAEQTNLFPFADERPAIQKCSVAVLDRRVSSRILTFRSAEARGLCVVPFRGGTTLNLGSTDEQLADVSDHSVPRDFYDNLAEVLTFYLPGLAKWRWTIRSHAYVCQKLGNVDQGSSRPHRKYGRRHFYWVPGSGPNIYFGYAGKFTLSANFAQQFVTELQQRCVLKKASSLELSLRDPKLADSPYTADPTHVLQPDVNGNIRFIDRRI